MTPWEAQVRNTAARVLLSPTRILLRAHLDRVPVVAGFVRTAALLSLITAGAAYGPQRIRDAVSERLKSYEASLPEAERAAIRIQHQQNVERFDASLRDPDAFRADARQLDARAEKEKWKAERRRQAWDDLLKQHRKGGADDVRQEP